MFPATNSPPVRPPPILLHSATHALWQGMAIAIAAIAIAIGIGGQNTYWTSIQCPVHHATTARFHTARYYHRARRSWKNNTRRQPHRIQWHHQRTPGWDATVSRQRSGRATTRNYNESIGNRIETLVHSTQDISKQTPE